MKTKNKLNQFAQELDYFDYLVTVVQKPHHRGVLKNIRKKIKALKAFIKNETGNSSDKIIIEQATDILQKFESLKVRFDLMYSKK